MSPVDEGFYVGGSAVISTAFSDPQQLGTAGDPATDPNTGFKYVIPTTVTCKLKAPDGREFALTVVPPAGGAFVYKANTPVFDVPGPWAYGWSAAGNYTDYKPGVIPVRAART